jgi:repressor LexA
VADLSDRQRKILEFISNFMEENGYPPTVRDIQNGCTISSTSVVDYNLNALREKGFLRRHADVSRGLQLLNRKQPESESETVAVPILGLIAAGSPISLPSADAPLPTEADEYVQLPQSVIGNGNKLYALQVKGQSMIDALIDDGDLVVMESVSTVADGEMAAVRLKRDEETTLKRFYAEGPTVRLQPANSTMEPLRVSADDVEVIGRVVAVWRYLN